jgi:uncharacterized membrane protein YkoI
MPTAEIADIDTEVHNGRTVYQIQFIEPGRNPTLYISQDGHVVPNPDNTLNR